jgi:hypothetical protein
MQEQWIKWEPIPHLASRYIVESIIMRQKGWSLLLSPIDTTFPSVKVFFTGRVEAYRRTNLQEMSALDSERKKLISSFAHGNSWAFFTVAYSSYLQWLSEESATLIERPGVAHYLILGENAIVDIVTVGRPIVKIVSAPREQ